MSVLFRRFQSGSIEAFGEYYKLYNRQVHLVIRRSCGDTIAKDLTQEVFKALWDHRDQIRNEEHLRHRIFYETKQFIHDHFRAARAAEKAGNELRHRIGAVERSVEANIVKEEVAMAVWEAVMKLPRKQNLVACLLYRDGLNTREIAGRLCIAEQTVRNHKAKALEFLKAELDGRDLFLIAVSILHSIR